MAASSTEAQYVTFGLGDECFAVPVEVVREILDHQDAFRIPHGPDYLLGLRDVRGQGVPIIDLRLRLGMSATAKTPHTRILVIDIPITHKALTLGLVADRVFEVTSFKHQSIESAPDIGVRWPSEYIAGVVRREGGFVVIIDLAKLFSSSDKVSLMGVGTGHQASEFAAV
ncbi:MULTISPECIES: chemotaxis protein CheW [Rhizobium]|jgi:purine-binding chemotaxis protein CheW|uniref:Chemotaxis protein CheW n=1 Tax=Rhizobium tropici TaxID=398 RepID=A0A329YFA6_RHITR|nr:MULTISPECIES: chemotaxis protein CheW [Rhizobium]MBB3290116.1 purine-binding chemotaxis protein CheW [Rhizobium sp. BK252]MBB3404996.1 purine-binding chemotaxis protein CheW [Rhizobium sp. BK289]MBB3417542.1 purine-binding chemotaxis protein CheW [Rhizobium sp. BK284]MBB3485252.1 purine-binding chemotaxis protein CheW [Rhizobium sp. BK347]RAX40482.1 chemotaxis protein CheW [Rhizobium tropici]